MSTTPKPATYPQLVPNGLAPRFERLRLMSMPAGNEGAAAGAPAAPAPTPPATPPTPATIAPMVAPIPQGAPTYTTADGTPVPDWFANDPAAAYAALLKARHEDGTARKEVRDASAEAGQAATDAVMKTVLAALGKNPDGTDLPKTAEALAAEVAESTTARETAETERDATKRENLVLRNAKAAGGDADKLLNFVPFVTELSSIGLNDTDAFTELVKKTVQANPYLASGPEPTPRSGNYNTGRTGDVAKSSGMPVTLNDAIAATMQGQ